MVHQSVARAAIVIVPYGRKDCQVLHAYEGSAKPYSRLDVQPMLPVSDRYATLLAYDKYKIIVNHPGSIPNMAEFQAALEVTILPRIESDFGLSPGDVTIEYADHCWHNGMWARCDGTYEPQGYLFALKQKTKPLEVPLVDSMASPNWFMAHAFIGIAV